MDDCSQKDLMTYRRILRIVVSAVLIVLCSIGYRYLFRSDVLRDEHRVYRVTYWFGRAVTCETEWMGKHSPNYRPFREKVVHNWFKPFEGEPFITYMEEWVRPFNGDEIWIDNEDRGQWDASIKRTDKSEWGCGSYRIAVYGTNINDVVSSFDTNRLSSSCFAKINRLVIQARGKTVSVSTNTTVQP